MKIYVVAFNGTSSGVPVVEFAATDRDACREYLRGKIVEGGMNKFISEVTLHDMMGEPVTGIRVDD